MKLCEKYFKSEKSALKGSLVIINLIPNPTLFQLLILKSLNEDERHDLGVMIKVANRFHHNASHVTEKAKNYFMLLSNASELTDTIKQLKGLPTWNPLAQVKHQIHLCKKHNFKNFQKHFQVVVLFTNIMNNIDELNEAIKTVFEELLTHSVLNVNIIYQNIDNPNSLEAVTWFPYQNRNCANKIMDIKIIDTCETFENESIQFMQFNGDLYPKIPKTFHECPLKITANVNEPYVVADSGSVKKGLEILMLETITEKMRMVPVYEVVDREIANRKISDSNETGLYASLIQR